MEMVKAKILLVDDKGTNRQLLRLILQGAGEEYVLAEAESGPAALEAVEREVPDIILLDVMMPEMDGYAVCQRLKAQERFRSIPVIFVTALSGTEDMVRCFKSGGADYIIKPVNAEEVKARLRVHLNISRVERTLRESEERYRAMANYSTDWESCVGMDGRLVWVNSAVEKITGYSVEECLALPMFPLSIVAPEDMDSVRGKFHDALQGGREEGVEIRIVNKDGSPRWGVFAWQPVFEQYGHMQGYRLSVRDITEQKKVEGVVTMMKRQLEQADKLATLGEMATSLAHEMNQPLGGIALIVAYLRKLIEKKLLTDEKIQDAIRSIETSIARMSKTVNHLRVYARREETPSFYPVDIAATIDSAMGLMGEQLRIHGIGLSLALGSQLPNVIGDPHQLEQVWINFISNARDSMDEKEKLVKEGKLSVPGYQKQLHISAVVQPESGMLLVTFADNGMGASEEDMKRVFEAFFTTKAEGKGTGLGLSISQGIIEKHQGRIAMEGKRGEGATLKVFLPAGNAA